MKEETKLIEIPKGMTYYEETKHMGLVFYSSDETIGHGTKENAFLGDRDNEKIKGEKIGSFALDKIEKVIELNPEGYELHIFIDKKTNRLMPSKIGNYTIAPRIDKEEV